MGTHPGQRPGAATRQTRQVRAPFPPGRPGGAQAKRRGRCRRAADRRSVPRARGKRPRRAVVDDVHDAHDAAAPVAVAGLDDSPDPNAVLAAHLSSGWSLGRKSDGDGRSLVPPGDGARGATTPANADRGTTSSELLVVRRAYGIEPPNAPSRASAPSDAAFASLSLRCRARGSAPPCSADATGAHPRWTPHTPPWARSGGRWPARAGTEHSAHPRSFAAAQSPRRRMRWRRACAAR